MYSSKSIWTSYLVYAFLSTMRIVLASQSERRQKLLSLLNFYFEIAEPQFEEKTQESLSPTEQAIFFAEQKALSLKEKYPNSLIIAADTLIDFEGRSLGKPGSIEIAKKMLSELSGKKHAIHTAMTILNTKKDTELKHLETIHIEFKKLSDAEIEAYLAKDYVLDKAGAYALQSQAQDLCKKIEGDLLSAIGLPLRKVAKVLKEEKILFNEGFLNHFNRSI